MNKSIVNTYQIVLTFVKNTLSYIIVFTTITMLFGYLHILSFLLSIDNIWLLNYIEYKTFMTQGLPVSVIVFFSLFLIFTDHLEFKKDFQKRFKIVLLVPLFGLVLLIAYNIYKEIFSPFLFYSIISVVASYFFLDISEIIDNISEKKNILTSSYIWWMLTAPFSLIIVVSTFGFYEGQHIQRGNFHALAKIENQSWGVLLNNNNSIILADLNSSKKIKIIRAVDVDYFLSDDNKTIEPIKNPQVDS